MIRLFRHDLRILETVSFLPPRSLDSLGMTRSVGRRCFPISHREEGHYPKTEMAGGWARRAFHPPPPCTMQTHPFLRTGGKPKKSQRILFSRTCPSVHCCLRVCDMHAGLLSRVKWGAMRRSDDVTGCDDRRDVAKGQASVAVTCSSRRESWGWGLRWGC